MGVKRAAAYYILLSGMLGLFGIIFLFSLSNLNNVIWLVAGGSVLILGFFYWRYWRNTRNPIEF